MGKSTVVHIINTFGLPVVDTDDLARDVVQPGTHGLEELVSRFGVEFLKADGSLDRPKMAAHIFGDVAERKKLEAIIHPRVRVAWQQQINLWREHKHPIVLVVVPLLYEVGVEAEFDLVLCVACTTGTQRARLRERGWDQGHVTGRITAQMDIAEKMNLADHVIWTEGQEVLLPDQLELVLS